MKNERNLDEMPYSIGQRDNCQRNQTNRLGVASLTLVGSDGALDRGVGERVAVSEVLGGDSRARLVCENL